MSSFNRGDTTTSDHTRTNKHPQHGRKHARHNKQAESGDKADRDSVAAPERRSSIRRLLVAPRSRPRTQPTTSTFPVAAPPCGGGTFWVASRGGDHARSPTPWYNDRWRFHKWRHQHTNTHAHIINRHTTTRESQRAGRRGRQNP